MLPPEIGRSHGPPWESGVGTVSISISLASQKCYCDKRSYRNDADPVSVSLMRVAAITPEVSVSAAMSHTAAFSPNKVSIPPAHLVIGRTLVSVADPLSARDADG